MPGPWPGPPLNELWDEAVSVADHGELEPARWAEWLNDVVKTASVLLHSREAGRTTSGLTVRPVYDRTGSEGRTGVRLSSIDGEYLWQRRRSGQEVQ
jgi:hypothetical protein